jgi:Na+/proline symporter/signal transduction histidine kinase
MNPWLILGAVTGYVALLFWIAWSADRRPKRAGSRQSVVYALSLCVYCTSWTYFGAVGTGSRAGWEFTTIYLGPILAVTLLFPLWIRVAAASKRVNAGSIADFLGARYGNSRVLGALVAIVAVVGSLPYIALQLKSLSIGWELLTNSGPQSEVGYPTAFVVAMVLAGFAILFGARRTELTAHNRGLVRAMAFESAIKLGGLLVAALIATAILLKHPGVDLPQLGPLSQPPQLDARFIVFTCLSAAALFCLPRQFHIAFVELDDLSHVGEAQRTVPIYLALTTLLVVPVAAVAGLIGAANPDLVVLEVPVRWGNSAATVIVLLGGFSAATAMVIVEAVALSAMISNELVLPLIAGRRWRSDRSGDHATAILLVRRISIVVMLGLAALYVSEINPAEGLATIGLTAFVAAAQFAPALVGAVVWRRGTALGAIAGIAAGFAIWFYASLLPQLGWSRTPAWMGQGDPLVVASLWSLTLNTFLFISVSMLRPARLSERVQAALFLGLNLPGPSASKAALSGAVRDLRDLTVRFLGAPAAERCFSDLAQNLGRELRDDDPVDAALVRAVERSLAGAIGSSSARGVVAAAVSGASGGPAEVKQLLDEAAQAVQFSRDLLQSALDAMEQGISVVDADLHLVAWNARYLQMFNFPPHLIHVGAPVAELIRFNAVHREWPESDAEDHINRRLANLRRRAPHTFERQRRDGRILRCVGRPIPGGGYVTTFSDITADRSRELTLQAGAKALEEANQSLERRVEARTTALRDAMAEVEAANVSMSRFIAAASHDLLQPLHAARLFVGALAEDLKQAPPGTQRLATQADRSIAAADALLRSLLNLSRLEAGRVETDVRPVRLDVLFEDLLREFSPSAEAKGIRLRCVSSTATVLSDSGLLRSVLQNLIGNGLAYTRSGEVLFGVRRDGANLRVEVWDTGPGIPDAAQTTIFGEFVRGPAGGAPGMGLGLAIVARIAALLDHPVHLRSAVGRGSVFSMRLPRGPAPAPLEEPGVRTNRLQGMRVLCVDDDDAILESMTALISSWGGAVDVASSLKEAVRLHGSWDVGLIDHHLGDCATGVDLVRLLGRRITRVAFVTAAREDALVIEANELGATVLSKPVEPQALREFLAGSLGNGS